MHIGDVNKRRCLTIKGDYKVHVGDVNINRVENAHR